MVEYQKFVFRTFPEHAVVRKMQDMSTVDVQHDNLITDVVVQHLENIVTDHVQDDGTSNKHVEEVDITQVRTESYDLGYKEATMALEPLMEQLKAEFHLADTLKQKLEEISPKRDVDKETMNLMIETIKDIADKLYLKLPMDFGRMLSSEMFGVVKKFYKDGKITLRVHKDRMEYCNNVVSSIGSLQRNNIDVVIDEDLGNNDCIIEWDETRVEYSHEQLKSEVDRIVNMLDNKG